MVRGLEITVKRHVQTGSWARGRVMVKPLPLLPRHGTWAQRREKRNPRSDDHFSVDFVLFPILDGRSIRTSLHSQPERKRGPRKL